MTATKPHYLVICGRPVQVPKRDTRSLAVQEAERKYGKQFGVLAWPTGEGAAYWTADRVARLAAENEGIRSRRKGKA